MKEPILLNRFATGTTRANKLQQISDNFFIQSPLKSPHFRFSLIDESWDWRCGWKSLKSRVSFFQYLEIEFSHRDSRRDGISWAVTNQSVWCVTGSCALTLLGNICLSSSDDMHLPGSHGCGWGCWHAQNKHWDTHWLRTQSLVSHQFTTRRGWHTTNITGLILHCHCPR